MDSLSHSRISLAMILGLVLISVSAIEVCAQTYTKQPYSETVVNGVSTIYAGKQANYFFTIPPDASNAYLSGTVWSRGGIISQILTTVTDSNGISHFRQMIPGAGRSISLLLPPGQSYYLNFINDAFLANEDKDVTANFILSYDKLVPVGSGPSTQIGGNMTVPPCTQAGGGSAVASVINESHIDPATGQTVLDCISP